MKEQSTTKGFAILSAGTVFVKILSLLYIPFLRVIIGDEGYGIFGAAYQVYVFIFVITNSGIPVAISKLVSELTAMGNYRDAVRGFKISRSILFLLGVVMSILLIIMANPLSKAVHYEKAYLSILSLAPAVLFTSIASAYRGYFQGRKNMIPTAASQVMEQTANTVFALIFSAYLMRYGVEVGCAGAPIGTSMGALISAAFLIYYYEKNKRFTHLKPTDYNGEVRRLKTKQLVKKIVYYSIPITICVGMTYAGNLVDLYNTKVRLMAGGFYDSQATILYGYLVKYQQLLNVPIAIISSLSAAILPALSAAAAVKDRVDLNGKINYSLRLCFLISPPSAAAILPALSAAAAVKDRVDLNGKINYSLRLCFLISLPCAVGLGILSTPIYNMLKFGNGSFIMAYGSVVLVLLSVMQIQSTILQGIGKLYIATIFSITGIVFKISTNYFLISIPKLNILGAIIGSVVGFAIPIILNQMVINKTLKGNIKLSKHALKPLLASLFMGAMVYFTYIFFNSGFDLIGKNYLFKTLAVLISIFAGAYYYLFGLIKTKGIKKKDLNMIPARFRKFIPKYFVKQIV